MTRASTPHSAAKRARLPWALVPVALLVSSALGVGSMAVIAARDPHFATEADYYQKAIAWDQTQAQAALNQRLGYVLSLPATVDFDGRGRATLELTLSDRLGQPVSGAVLAGSAFANAFSREIVNITFEERAAGRYSAKLDIRHRGQWVFRLAGDAGSDHFTADLRADLSPGGAS